MRCQICGGQMEGRTTDLPFKLGDASIVTVKASPALQCRQCGDIELDHAVVVKVEQMLSSVDRTAELEVLRHLADYL